MQDRHLIASGAFLMLLAVAFGAFGAHALKPHLGSDMLAIWHTAVLYHMVHALGCIAIGILMPRYSQQSTKIALAGTFMLIGVLVFSGSLYLLALTGQRWLGAITPVGGAAFLAAWGMLGWVVWNCRETKG